MKKAPPAKYRCAACPSEHQRYTRKVHGDKINNRDINRSRLQNSRKNNRDRRKDDLLGHTGREADQKKPQGPNIGEQKEVMKETVERGANAIVSECMAVNPDYQIIFQEELLQANIGVIVNVLEDHMDVMGPTLDEIAEAFTATIPYNGHLVITDSEYTDFFKQIAKERNTKVIVADNSKITDEYLRQFEYMVFPDNASLALGVAQALGIDEETAFKGMLNAPPDPGAMRILPLMNAKNPGHFVNGFAANDAASTLNIWKRVKK